MRIHLPKERCYKGYTGPQIGYTGPRVPDGTKERCYKGYNRSTNRLYRPYTQNIEGGEYAYSFVRNSAHSNI